MDFNSHHCSGLRHKMLSNARFDSFSSLNDSVSFGFCFDESSKRESCNFAAIC